MPRPPSRSPNAPSDSEPVPTTSRLRGVSARYRHRRSVGAGRRRSRPAARAARRHRRPQRRRASRRSPRSCCASSRTSRIGDRRRDRAWRPGRRRRPPGRRAGRPGHATSSTPPCGRTSCWPAATPDERAIRAALEHARLLAWVRAAPAPARHRGRRPRRPPVRRPAPAPGHRPHVSGRLSRRSFSTSRANTSIRPRPTPSPRTWWTWPGDERR